MEPCPCHQPTLTHQPVHFLMILWHVGKKGLAQCERCPLHIPTIPAGVTLKQRSKTSIPGPQPLDVLLVLIKRREFPGVLMVPDGGRCPRYPLVGQGSVRFLCPDLDTHTLSHACERWAWKGAPDKDGQPRPRSRPLRIAVKEFYDELCPGLQGTRHRIVNDT